MYNKDKKESGYAFFDVESDRAESFVAKPHLVKHALINCKIAADNSKISQVQKDEMERKLYVSNLPPGTSDIDLLHLFEPFGRLTKAYLVRNRLDGSCKNFGFVIFQEQKDVEALLQDFPTIKFRQRKLTVKQAVDRQTQKHLKKTSLRPHYESIRRRASEERMCSSKLQLLNRTTQLNEEESNYKFNIPLPRRPRIPVQRTSSLPGTSQSLPFQSSLTFLKGTCHSGQFLHN